MMVAVLFEARKKARTVKDITPGRAAVAQQAALMRLQIYLTGETHRRLAEFAEKVQRIVLNNAGADGILDAGEMYQTQMAIYRMWDETFMGPSTGAQDDGWMGMFQGLRREAASIPYGTLALMHEKMVRPRVMTEAKRKASPVFEPQLQALLDAATQRIYQDGFSLSTRIWRLDREVREGINRELLRSITESRSAWDTAKDLEKFLGANQDCPRWTSTRLNVLSKKDIAAGVRTGLKTGAECEGQGVAYKALRLARNEIQTVHHLATDQVMAAQPWVEKEQIILSAAHPVRDICDDIAGGGEGGQGIYPVGQITLPLHVQCLCYKVTVRQPEGEFVDRLRGWMRGGSDQGLDGYAQSIGGKQAMGTSLLDDAVAQALGVWLFGGTDELSGRLS